MSGASGPARAVISLGTNTTRLLIVREAADGSLEQLEHGAIGTRLGEGLRDGGALTPGAMARTTEAVGRFVERVRARDATVAAIATSAMRRADNANEFGERIGTLIGSAVHILDGDEEAAHTYRGATASAPHDGSRRAVLDVGGGSTECAVGRDGVLEGARSIEIGSVRLTERFRDLAGGAPGTAARIAAAEARAAVDSALTGLPEFRPVAEVRCVAGTALTLGAIAFRSTVDLVSGRALTRVMLERTIDRLLNLTLAERKALPGMLPQRADVLVAGGIVVSEALRLLRCDSALLEADDLLLGFLLSGRRSG